MEHVMADFPLTNAKNDVLKGTTGNDTFTISGAYTDLAATDKITGGGGSDALVVQSGGTGQVLTDAQFTGISGVQTIIANAEFHVVLGAKAGAAGIVTIDGTNFNDTLDVNAASYANKAGTGVTIIAGSASGEIDLIGSKFADTFKIGAAALGNFTSIGGGDGTDTLQVKFTGDTVTDADLVNVSGIEKLIMTGDTATLNLGSNAGKAGINFIDGSTITDTLVIDAGAYTNAAGTGVTIQGGNAFTNLKGSAADDTFTFSDTDFKNATPIVNGGGGNDTLQIAANGAQISNAAFASVINVERLLLTGDGASVTLSAGTGINRIDGSAITDSLEINASLVSKDLVLVASAASNTLTLGTGDDTVILQATALKLGTSIDGNDGDDVLVLNGDGKTAITVADSVLVGVESVETVRFTNATTATITLGTNGAETGIKTVDGSAVTGALTVTASAVPDGVTVLTGAGAGTQALTGGVGDDRFVFTSAGLSAKDKVDGGGYGDSDVIVITDKAAVADAAFTGVKNVEGLVIGDGTTVAADYTGAKVTLGKLSELAGIGTVENVTDYGVTVDASARALFGVSFTGGAGDDTFVGSKFSDSFTGGGGDDTLVIKQGALIDDRIVFIGGAGNDTVRISDAQDAKNPTPLSDDKFGNLVSVERLAFDGTGHQSVELGTLAQDAGIAVVDAGKVTGGIDLDAAAMATDLAVIAGSGVDSIQLGSGDHLSVSILSTKLTKDDFINGGFGGGNTVQLHFTDTVKLADAYFATNTSQVLGFNELLLDGTGAGQTLTAAANFANFVGNSGINWVEATSESAASSTTFDFSAYNGTDLTIIGGAGNDVFIGGAGAKNALYGGDGDDVFKFTSAAFANHGAIQGEGGTNTLLLTYVPDNNGGMTVSDADFSGIAAEKLVLGAAKSGFYQIAMAGDADLTGIALVDASAAGVDFTLLADTSTADLTVIAGAKNNLILGGTGDDTIKIDTKTLDKNDQLDGGGGSNDTLVFTSGGAVSIAGLEVTAHFEFIQLADAGNSIALTDAAIGNSDGAASIDFNGTTYDAFAFVLGGKGSDTINLSATDSLSAAVLAGSGKDTLIGSDNHDDVFLFAKAGDLDAGDKISGGAGDDSVILTSGAYSSDQFKGFNSIEQVKVLGGADSADSSFTIKNDYFAVAVADPSAAGAKLLTIDIETPGTDDRIDASAVTGTLNNLNVSSGDGDDTLIGGAGNDTFRFHDDDNGAFTLTADDTVQGGGGADAILLSNTSGAAAALEDTGLAGVSGVERIAIDPDSGADITVNLGANAADAGISQISAEGWIGNLTVNATAYDDNGLPVGITVKAGTGDDSLTLSDGDDTVVYATSADLDDQDIVDGGDGRDSIVIADGSGLGDGQLKNVSNMEVVKLIGAGGTVTLDANAKAKGIEEVDASQAQAKVTVSVTNDADTTVLGSSFGDTITGGAGDDVIYGGLGRDFLTGGKGSDIFVYRSAGDSANTGGATPTYDEITGFSAGDQFDFSAFGIQSGTAKFASPGAFPGDPNSATYFSAGSIATLYDGSDTYVFVDANADGKYTAADDLEIVLKATDATALFDSSILASTGTSVAPFHPAIKEDKVLQISGGTHGDDELFKGTFAGDYNAVTPLDLAASYTITLDKLSDLVGVRVFDWSASKGALTINGAAREQPLFIAASSGVNNLTGSHSDDIFYFTAAALAKSTVNGGGSLEGDTLYIAEKSALVDAAFAKVSNVEILEFGPNQLPGGLPVDVAGQKVVLGAKSESAGITTVVNDWDTGLTVDASARTKAAITFQGGSGDDVFYNAAGAKVSDTFLAGGGNDSFRTKLANFLGTAADTFQGGLGSDEVRVLDAWDGKTAALKITDAAFAGFSSVEKLVFDAAGKQDVTLDSNALDAGLSLIDGSKTAGLNVTVTSGFTDALSVIAGTGNDKITLGNGGGEIVVASTKFTKDDLFDGTAAGGAVLHFTDAVKLTDKSFAGVVNSAKGISELDLDSAASGQSLAVGASFGTFVSNAGLSSVIVTQATDFTADFSAYADNSISFFSNAGKDTVILDANGAVSVDTGAGNDTIKVGSAALGNNLAINGGDGTDTLLVTDATATIDTANFKTVADIETIALGALKLGTYEVVLGTETDAGGVRTVDGSLAGVAVEVDASASTEDLTLIGSAKINRLQGGDGNDTFIMDAKTFGADDTISGNLDASPTAATAQDYLKFSTGGAIAAAGLANIDNIEAIWLSDAGNSIAVTAAMVAQADGTVGVSVDGVLIGLFDFAVSGGKGKDTIDLSASGTGGHVAVVAGAGSDVLTGGANEDVFVFANAGDFDKTDVVNGGADYDTVVLATGNYAADAFKGLASIEEIRIVDDNSTSDDSTSIALDSSVFKAATLVDGLYQLHVNFGESGEGTQIADYSKVTQANAVITTQFGIGDVEFHGGVESDILVLNDDGVGGFTLGSGGVLAGGLGVDTIALNVTGNDQLLDSSLEDVSGFEHLALSGTGDVSVEFGELATDAGLQVIDARNLVGKLTVTVGDFDNGLTVYAAKGDNDITLGEHNDIAIFDAAIHALTKNDTVDGGNSDLFGFGDILRFNGDSTVDDDALAGVSNVERIDATGGTLDLTLDANADKAGIGNVDGSKSDGLTLEVDAGFTRFLGVDGSKFDDEIDLSSAGAGGSQIIGHGGGDQMTAGAGDDQFFYMSTGDSVLGVGGDASRMDTITGYSYDTNAHSGDVIDLSAFFNADGGLTGTVVEKTGVVLGSINSDQASFFGGKGDVAVSEIGGDTYVFADVNHDGNLNLGSDIVIKLVGTHKAELIGGGVLATTPV
jgi:Ca2+-binding RTX toxin-like protein